MGRFMDHVPGRFLIDACSSLCLNCPSNQATPLERRGQGARSLYILLLFANAPAAFSRSSFKVFEPLFRTVTGSTAYSRPLVDGVALRPIRNLQ